MLSPVKIWRNQKKIAALLGQTGKIISWTIVRVPPANFSEQAPYPVVIVELDNGQRITAQLVDPPDGRERSWEIKVGLRVVTIIRRVTQPNTEGVIPYGIKVKPL